MKPFIYDNIYKYLECFFVYFQLVIKRGKRGYGFSVTGSSPACVRRVEDGSVAWRAGLRVDDAVIRINGQNVSRSIADSVAKIVRQSEKQIIMDIQRENMDYQKQTDKLSARKPLGTISEEDNIQENSWCGTDDLLLKGDFDLHSISNDSAMDVSHDMSHDQLINIGQWQAPRSPEASLPSIRIRFQDLTQAEQDRQAVVQNLLRLEQDFIKQMQFSIHRYSNPLRHKFVSPSEHLTLFQNIEKLISISEYHVYKLQEESIRYSDVKDSTETFIDMVGCIYLPKVRYQSDKYT